MTSVSVILTFYDNLAYVERALRQVLAQDHQDYELLVIDDGSTDGTAAALVEAVAQIPQARLLLNPTNLGVAASRNRAVAESTGEYVWFVDCDDDWSPRILGELARRAETTGADLVVCGAVRMRHEDDQRVTVLDGRTPGSYQDASAVRALLTGEIRGYLWNKLIRRELLLRHPFPPQSSQSDLAVITEIVFSGARCVTIPGVMYRHIERSGSITNSRIASFANMDASLDRVESLVSARADAHRLADDLSYFRQWAYRSSLVNTALRLGTASPQLDARVRELMGEASVRDLLVVARRSRREAVIAALMKFARPAYPFIYRRHLARR